jgi:hypothetical protein
VQRQKAKRRFQSVLGFLPAAVEVPTAAPPASLPSRLAASRNTAEAVSECSGDDFEYSLPHKDEDACGVRGEESQAVNDTCEEVGEIPLLPDFATISRTDVASLVWPRGPPGRLGEGSSETNQTPDRAAVDECICPDGDAVLADMCKTCGGSQVSMVCRCDM